MDNQIQLDAMPAAVKAKKTAVQRELLRYLYDGLKDRRQTSPPAEGIDALAHECDLAVMNVSRTLCSAAMWILLRLKPSWNARIQDLRRMSAELQDLLGTRGVETMSMSDVNVRRVKD